MTGYIYPDPAAKEAFEAYDKQGGYETYKQKIRDDLSNRLGLYNAAEFLVRENPIYYDTNGIWWVWERNKQKWIMTDETDILNICRDALEIIGDDTVRMKNNLLEALRQVSRKNRPKDLPPEWIQLGTTQYNIKTNESRNSTSEWLSTNVIPWAPGGNVETPTIDALFLSWVGDEYATTLKEIIAYCCYRDYPIHVIIVLTGTGRNGKSSFIRLLRKFIEKDNIAATDLDRLTKNRFETFNLYKRLVAIIAETDVTTLTTTSKLKQLSGQDPVPFEKKGLTGFTDINYSKLIIATNSLPNSEDTSEGYYRRWLIIDFPYEFPEGKDVIETIPNHEYNALSRQVITILPKLLDNGQFTKQGTIEERKARYIAASNPLESFIEDNCYAGDPGDTVEYQDLFQKYNGWLRHKKRRPVKAKEFTRALEAAGFEHKWTKRSINGIYDNVHWIYGLRWRAEPKQNSQLKGGVFNHSSHSSHSNVLSLSTIRVKEELNSSRMARNARNTYESIDAKPDSRSYAYEGDPGTNVPIHKFTNENPSFDNPKPINKLGILLEYIREKGHYDKSLIISKGWGNYLSEGLEKGVFYENPAGIIRVKEV